MIEIFATLEQKLQLKKTIRMRMGKGWIKYQGIIIQGKINLQSFLQSKNSRKTSNLSQIGE